MAESSLKVVLAGRSELGLKKLETDLRAIPHTEVSSLWIPADETDALAHLTVAPDILVLELGVDPEAEMDLLARKSAVERPVMFIVGPPDNTSLMRKALQAGVRDFFVRPAESAEVMSALRRVVKEKLETGSRFGQVTVFMNAKGGSGATLIASNVAHVMAEYCKARVALLDFDFQYGSIGLNFDLSSGHSIASVIKDIDDVDLVALEAYMAKHASGLHILTHPATEITLPGEIPEAKVKRLLDLTRRLYDHIVIDIPRQFDPILVRVIDEADHIVLVMQQSVAHVRDTKRLLHILRVEMSVPESRVMIVVNRYSTKNPLRVKELSETLGFTNFFTLSNDYYNVAQSLNVGRPLMDFARHAEITRHLVELGEVLSGHPPKREKTMLQKVFPFLS